MSGLYLLALASLVVLGALAYLSRRASTLSDRDGFAAILKTGVARSDVLHAFFETLEDRRQVVLYGPSGAGKSWFVDHVLASAWAQRRVTPVIVRSIFHSDPPEVRLRRLVALWGRAMPELQPRGDDFEQLATALTELLRTRRVALILDQFDDYIARAGVRLESDGSRLQPAELARRDRFWALLGRLLDTGGLTIVFVVRDDTMAETLTFLRPDVATAQQRLQAVTRPTLTPMIESLRATVRAPHLGWDALVAQLLNDAEMPDEHGGAPRILPIRVVEALEGMARFERLSPRTYERRGGLAGIEAHGVDALVDRAADRSGYGSQWLLDALAGLVDADQQKTVARPLRALLERAGRPDDLGPLRAAFESLAEWGLLRADVDGAGARLWSLRHDHLRHAVLTLVERRLRPSWRGRSAAARAWLRRRFTRRRLAPLLFVVLVAFVALAARALGHSRQARLVHVRADALIDAFTRDRRPMRRSGAIGARLQLAEERLSVRLRVLDRAERAGLSDGSLADIAHAAVRGDVVAFDRWLDARLAAWRAGSATARQAPALTLAVGRALGRVDVELAEIRLAYLSANARTTTSAELEAASRALFEATPHLERSAARVVAAAWRLGGGDALPLLVLTEGDWLAGALAPGPSAPATVAWRWSALRTLRPSGPHDVLARALGPLLTRRLVGLDDADEGALLCAGSGAARGALEAAFFARVDLAGEVERRGMLLLARAHLGCFGADAVARLAVAAGSDSAATEAVGMLDAALRQGTVDVRPLLRRLVAQPIDPAGSPADDAPRSVMTGLLLEHLSDGDIADRLIAVADDMTASRRPRLDWLFLRIAEPRRPAVLRALVERIATLEDPAVIARLAPLLSTGPGRAPRMRRLRARLLTLIASSSERRVAAWPLVDVFRPPLSPDERRHLQPIVAQSLSGVHGKDSEVIGWLAGLEHRTQVDMLGRRPSPSAVWALIAASDPDARRAAELAGLARPSRVRWQGELAMLAGARHTPHNLARALMTSRDTEATCTRFASSLARRPRRVLAALLGDRRRNSAPYATVTQLQCVARLMKPESLRRFHRRWFLRALTNSVVARLYRTSAMQAALGKDWPRVRALFRHLAVVRIGGIARAGGYPTHRRGDGEPSKGGLIANAAMSLDRWGVPDDAEDVARLEAAFRTGLARQSGRNLTRWWDDALLDVLPWMRAHTREWVQRALAGRAGSRSAWRSLDGADEVLPWLYPEPADAPALAALWARSDIDTKLRAAARARLAALLGEAPERLAIHRRFPDAARPPAAIADAAPAPSDACAQPGHDEDLDGRIDEGCARAPWFRHAVSVPGRGGRGGHARRRRCRDDEALVGLILHGQDPVRTIDLECARFDFLHTAKGPQPRRRPGARRIRLGREPQGWPTVEVRCRGARDIVTGLSIDVMRLPGSKPLVGGVGLRCAPVRYGRGHVGSSAGLRSYPVGDVGDDAERVDCGPSTVVHGLHGGFGRYVDRLGPRCAIPTTHWFEGWPTDR